MRRRTCSLLFIVLVLGLVGCDHATKQLAQSELRGHPPTPLIAGVLDLHYTENRAVAFSLLRQVPERVRKPLIFGVGTVSMALLGLVWWRRRGARWQEQLAYAALLGGGLGNLTDRWMRGYVVDFVYLHHWPVFNAADAYLVVGAALILLGARSAEPAAPKLAPAPK